MTELCREIFKDENEKKVQIIDLQLLVNSNEIACWAGTCCMSCNFVGASMNLMASNLDDRGINPTLITHKSRYSFSLSPKNDFPIFYFNPDSASFCKNLSRAFRWSLK